jgi:hypothetical protein
MCLKSADYLVIFGQAFDDFLCQSLINFLMSWDWFSFAIAGIVINIVF